jgi:tartrate-resistant acid phosphatase type 5
MGKWASKNRNDFVISTGDNFYPKGVISEHDPLWHYSFENVYTSYSLQCNWYPVLGNHDYGADPDAQIRYSKISRRWNMPSRYYSREVSLGDQGKVLFVMIDTNPMIDEDAKKQTAKQLTWLRKTLQNASADVKWKFVTGHHPCYTVGPRIKNKDVLAVREILNPIFEEHKVDVYLAGHEHSLQHLKPEGYTHQFISGAGSSLSGVASGIPYSRFEASRNGFLYFSMDSTQMIVKAINEEGKIMYQTEIKK